jgi:hypothetical protein
MKMHEAPWSAAAELAELPPWLGIRGYTKGGSSASSAAALQVAFAARIFMAAKDLYLFVRADSKATADPSLRSG